MSEAVLFISANAAQSAYWADKLGLGQGEWRHLGHPKDVLGVRRNATVYLVGTWTPSVQGTLDELRRRGVECSEFPSWATP